jgi:hypothetical protein
MRPRPVSLPIPPQPPRIRHAAAIRALPRPTAPLVFGPTLQPAPLPDLDKTAPPRVRLPVEVAPTLYWPRPDIAGDGFLPGSQHLTQIELPGSAPAGVKFTIPIN